MTVRNESNLIQTTNAPARSSAPIVKPNDRPDFLSYMMVMAEVVARRTTCLKVGHGAILVRDKQIISTGYNGAPVGYPHCQVIGCGREGAEPGTRYEDCVATHAEQNAIAQAARHGMKTDGASLFITGLPCNICARIIANAGIKEVFYLSSGRYQDLGTRAIFGFANIKLQAVIKKGDSYELLPLS